jgi:hypothetical protein
MIITAVNVALMLNDCRVHRGIPFIVDKLTWTCWQQVSKAQIVATLVMVKEEYTCKRRRLIKKC